VNEIAFGSVLTLAWFGVITLVASAIVSAVAWWLERRDVGSDRTPSERTLLLLRLLPGASSLFFTFAIFLPAQWRFEPRGSEEEAGVSLILLALVGLVTAAFTARRAIRDVVVTSRLTRTWFARARRCEIPGETAFPVYRLPGEAPVLSLTGIFAATLFVSDKVLDAFTADEFAASVAHERAHRDAWDNLKRAVVSFSPDCLALFGPGRRIEARWRAALEFSADARAVDGNEDRAVALAGALLKIVRLAPEPRACPGITFYDGTVLSARIDRLLSSPSRPRPFARRRRMVSAICGVAALGAAILTAEAVWLSVHLVTEGLVRFLP
jgi:hypothetical protein